MEEVAVGQSPNLWQKPEWWQREERIQWGCVLMHLLGEDSLQHLHIVLTGLHSVEQSLQAVPYVRAIRTARILLSDVLTQNAVQSAIYDFLDHATQRSFIIDPKTKQFTALYAEGLDPNITRAAQVLREGLPRRTVSQSWADTAKDLVVHLDNEGRMPIRMHNISFPSVQQHDLTRRSKQSLAIQWSELRELAEQLDQEDQQANRQSQDWIRRFGNMRLQATTGAGLQDTDVLDLCDLKHLIGLPGSGKTTLITLLCVLMKRRGRRVAVFFTSIGVAREYLEVLRRYDVNVALLMGRSGQTHRRHANDMAELIAGQGEGGFGQIREGIELFATSCPLPAFAESWPQEWIPGDAPCESIYDVASGERKLCPAWERCGRVKNQRNLVTADVWLGHVISADTTVPAHTSAERLQYFELVAETFDLVIFDECDETQKVLDAYGTLTLELTGNDQSLHIDIQRMAGLLAANRTQVSDSVLRYILQANEFERHMLRFLAEIRRLFQQAGTQKLANAYADQLLTANFLIREALSAAKTYHLFTSRALSALSDFWERAMYQAFFFRSDDDAIWPKAATYAPELGLTISDAHGHWKRVNRALKRYLTLDHASEAAEVIDEIVNELVPIFHADSADQIRDHVRLLIVVGFTIASYQRLAKLARPLAQRGEIPDDLVSSRSSLALRAYVPRSIIGTFSAVRYRRAPEGNGYEIDYLVTDSTPRLLLHHMHEMGSAHVLLTSATSWMAASTEYHVDKRPNYVLAPNTDEVGTVRLYTLPKKHPATQKPLRFSGGGSEREDNLRHMVTALAQPDTSDLSELERAVRSVTTNLGRQRKAALIVNSYEQVRLVVEHIHDVNPVLAQRTRGVLKERPQGIARSRYILKGQVEELGRDDEVMVVVFPIAALGRGINIVFRTHDKDNGKAAVGSIYFLTRPHPAAGDLSLMTSLLARVTQDLDQEDFQHQSLADIQHVYNSTRYRIYRRVANLLSRPMSASRLDRETLRNFAANLLVPIIQTIGRGMRKQMPIDVYFVDAAWAPRSAEGLPESERSSILLIMHNVLEECLSDPDPDLRDVSYALYGVFRDAFRNIVGLMPASSVSQTQDDFFNPSPITPEADFDSYDLDTEDSEIDGFDDPFEEFLEEVADEEIE
jgi:hypothetical protein